MTITKSQKTYILLCGLLISCHFADMLSTNYVLNHSDGSAIEINPAAAKAQAGSGLNIILVRIATITLFAIGFFFSRITAEQLEHLKSFSAISIFLGKVKNINNNTIYKFMLFISLAMVCLSRLMAAVSNLSGQFFKMSLTIFIEKIIGVNDLTNLYFLSVIFTTCLSLIIISISWEIYRKI